MSETDNNKHAEIEVHAVENHTPPVIDKRNPYRRYLGVIGSVAAMLLAAGGVGVYNQRQNNIIAENTMHIDVAGYMSDSFYQIALNGQYLSYDIYAKNVARLSGEPTKKFDDNMKEIVKSLQVESADIISYAKILGDGGVFDKTGQAQVIPAMKSAEYQAELAKVSQRWTEYRQLLEDVYKADFDKPEGLARANELSEFTRKYQAEMYDTLDIIISGLTEENISRKGKIDTVLLFSALGLAFLFLVFVGVMVRRLSRSDLEIQRSADELQRSADKLAKSHISLAKAQQESRDILDAVSDGFMLIDEKMNIAGGYSSASRQLLGATELADQSLIDILGNIIPDRKALETAFQFIQMLYSPTVFEDMVGDLNTLNEIKVRVPNLDNGMLEDRYLSFDFRRRPDEDGSMRMFVSVRDITKELELRDRVSQKENVNNMQLDMFSKLMQMPRSTLSMFVETLRQRTKEINDLLQRDDKGDIQLKDKLKHLKTPIHALKGDASMMGMSLLANYAIEMEDYLTRLDKKPVLIGDDFLPTANTLREMLKLSSMVDLLVTAILSRAETTGENALDPENWADWKGGIGNLDEKVAASTLPALKGDLEAFVRNLGINNKKAASISTSGFMSLDISAEKYLVLKDILVQLVRNSMVHGVETPKERAAAGKKDTGQINIALSSVTDAEGHQRIRIDYSDDGKGLDPKKIIAKALEKGIIRQREADSLTEEGAYRLIFKNGMSTADKVTQDAGQGVGMNVIANLIQNHGGRLNIGNAKGQGLRFIINI